MFHEEGTDAIGRRKAEAVGGFSGAMEEVPDKWKAFISKNYEHFGLDAP